MRTRTGSLKPLANAVCRLVPALAVGVLAGGFAQPAAASPPCGCPSNLDRYAWTLEEVPRNPRVLMRGAPEDRFVVRPGPVPLDVRPSEFTGLIWLEPRELLVAGEDYTIQRVDEDDDPVPTTGPLPILRVGEDVDEMPPVVVNATIEPTAWTASCYPFIGAALKIDFLIDGPTAPFSRTVYVVLDVTIDGKTERKLVFVDSGVKNTVDFGRNEGCPLAAEFASAREGAVAAVAVTYTDLAGNVVTSPPVDVPLQRVQSAKGRPNAGAAAGGNGAGGVSGSQPSVAGEASQSVGSEAGAAAGAGTAAPARPMPRESSGCRTAGHADGGALCWLFALFFCRRRAALQG